MKRFALGRSGVVIGFHNAEDFQALERDGVTVSNDVFEDGAGTINVGDAYDVSQLAFNKVDPLSLKIILSLQNEIRALQSKPALADVEALKVELKKTVTADAVAVEAVIKP